MTETVEQLRAEAVEAINRCAWTRPANDDEAEIERLGIAIRKAVDDLDAEDGTLHASTVAELRDSLTRPELRLIHCRGNLTGADWSAEDALRMVATATAITWRDGLIGHNLGVQEPSGAVWWFEASRLNPDCQPVSDAGES